MRQRGFVLALAALGFIVALIVLLLRSSGQRDERAQVIASGADSGAGVELPDAAPESAPQPAAPDVEGAGTPETTEAVAPAALLRGRVVDASGRPLAQAGVLLVLDRGDAWTKHWTFLQKGPDAVPTHVITGADGRFELRAEAPGSAAQPRLVVHHEGHATRVQPCLGLRAEP